MSLHSAGHMSEVTTCLKARGKGTQMPVLGPPRDSDITPDRGRLVKDRDTGKPKLNTRNWECGVVLSVPNPTATAAAARAGDSTTRGTKGGAELLEVFRGSAIPIPMEVPGLPFRNDERRPWFSDES